MADFPKNISNNFKRKLSLTEKDIKRSKASKKLDHLLEYMFELGYDRRAPKWYWIALKEVLLQMDEIINYVPETELDNFLDIDIYEPLDSNVEMNDFEIFVNNENINSTPIIECCWKLLDLFYEKLDHKNLNYVRYGLLIVFHRTIQDNRLKYHEILHDKIT